MFDLVFAEGVEALFRFAVALLKRNEAYLLTLEFEDLIDFLKNGLFEAYAVRIDRLSQRNLPVADVADYVTRQPDERELMQNPDAEYRIHEFVRDALQVRITPMMLVRLVVQLCLFCFSR